MIIKWPIILFVYQGHNFTDATLEDQKTIDYVFSLLMFC